MLLQEEHFRTCCSNQLFYHLIIIYRILFNLGKNSKGISKITTCQFHNFKEIFVHLFILKIQAQLVLHDGVVCLIIMSPVGLTQRILCDFIFQISLDLLKEHLEVKKTDFWLSFVPVSTIIIRIVANHFWIKMFHKTKRSIV